MIKIDVDHLDFDRFDSVPFDFDFDHFDDAQFGHYDHNLFDFDHFDLNGLIQSYSLWLKLMLITLYLITLILIAFIPFTLILSF